MDAWVSGALALVGAVVGVLLSTYLSRSTKRRDVQRRRLEEALRCVVLAIAARHFVTRVGMEGRSPSVRDEDVEELERRIYLSNLERLFVSLREARHAVGVLVADGFDVGDAWRGDSELQEQLEPLYQRLLSELKLK